MKKVKSLGLVIILVGIFNMSYGQKKVALTTFYVSKHIGFEELGGNAALVASIASLSENPDFNLQPVLDNFYTTFMKDYAPQFPFEFLPENEVTGNENYKGYEGRFNESKDADRSKLFQRFLTAEGYKPLQESLVKGEKSNQMQMVEMFKPTADGIMFVSMGYDFVKKPVPFTAGIRAFIRIKVWNNEGKKVFAINEYGTSKESVAIVGGIPIMKTEKLLPLCESASEKLVADLNKKVKKKAAKAAKKL
ncbi:hypothetical protein N9R81_01440 [Flavobacteriales bacterium]|nr:hypothetical protein [Flavobacteriales bacterium]